MRPVKALGKVRAPMTAAVWALSRLERGAAAAVYFPSSCAESESSASA